LNVFKPERLAILAEGKLGVLTSKTAACVVRYQPERVVCVMDSTKQGSSVQEVLGFGGDIPVVGSLDDALAFKPDTLLIGIAPRGGALPDEWRRIVLEAIHSGLDIISGLHTMLSEDSQIKSAAESSGIRIWDIRKPVVPTEISRGALKERDGSIILTVGSDCRTGKMTVAYELTRFLRGKDVDAEFVPTGQTGILLSGWGVAVDRVPGDFMSKVVEDLTVHALKSARVVVVEGQGSLIHPGYSGVALAIQHGCYPDWMILCHDPGRREIDGYGLKIPSLEKLVRIHEEASALIFPSRVIGLALNTYGMAEDRARAVIAEAEESTGLPATDVIRWGCDRLYRAVEDLL
jgi:uncharacterized NAD-dependent epimerase/dehydratase family protein